MTPEEYQQVQAKFLEFQDLGKEERQAKLRQIEATEPALADVLAKLLDSSEADFLEQPYLKHPRGAQPGDGQPEDVQSEDLQPAESRISSGEEDPESSSTETFEPASDRPTADPQPENIGPFRILQKIGEGGHGVVYMAEQKVPIRRKVALKLIKPGMQSKEILARFEAERQALALMKHPSIANVLDAGTDSTGQPYFVMELVRGLPIDEFCKRNKLSLSETLVLFQQVCEAVHHAHRKGIIHRDLKPGNVLVTLDSGKPLAKVIDFGIAKALHLSLTDQTMFTQFGQIVGTLEFMSPEQATLSQDLPDVRSDVYSLGVVLYLLLTGETPISKQQLLQRGLLEMASAFEENRPATPSLRFSRGDSARDWKQVSDSDRRAWMSRLRGDLDWITMKSLDQDPKQRYDSAADFAGDIENFLSGKPVVARPPTLGYRLSKWIRRHRVAAVLIATLSSSLIICVASITFAYLTTKESLNDVKEAEQFAKDKALALSDALDETQKQRSRADATSERLAKRLKREILASAWTQALNGDGASAAQQLDSLPESERDYVWDWVDGVRQQVDWPLLRSSERGPIRAARLNPSNGQFALITTDSVLELWDVHQAKLVTTHQLKSQLYSCMAFSSDGDAILVGAPGWCGRWDLRTGDLKAEITHGHGGTRGLAYDRVQKQWWVTTGSNHVLTLTQEELNVVSEVRLSQRLTRVSVSPDGQVAVAATNRGSAYFIPTAETENAKEVSVSDSPIGQLRWTDKKLLTCDQHGACFRIDLDALTSERMDASSFVSQETRQGDTSQLTALCFRNNEQIFVAKRSGEISLVVGENREVPVRSFSKSISELYVDSDSGQLFVRHFDGSINSVTKEDVDCRATYAEQLDDLTDGLALETELRSVTAHEDGTVYLWDTTSGEAVHSNQMHDGAVLSVDAHAADRSLASFGQDWRIRVSAIDELTERWSRAASYGVRVVEFDHSGRRLAGPPEAANKVGLREGTIDIWDARTGAVTQRLVGHKNWVMQLDFSRDDRRLYSYALDGVFRVWNLEDASCLSALDLSKESPVTCFCVLERSGSVVFGHEDGSLSLWDVDKDEVQRRAYLLSSSVSQMIAPTNSSVVIVSAESSPKLTCVDTRTLEMLVELDAGLGPIRGIRADRNFRRVQLLGQKGAARIWQLPEIKRAITAE